GDTAAGKFLKADAVWTVPAGGGDVAGPGSSTDNAIVRFHETSGKVIQDYTSNPPTISDTGDVNIDGDLDVENIVVSGNVDGKDVSTLGVGDVTAGAVMIDHAIVRGDGGAKGIQDSGILINDADAVSGITGMDVTLAAADQVLLDGRTNNRTESLGILRVNFTPAAGDVGEDCIHLDIDANSVNDVMAIKVDYLATGLAPGNENMAIELNLETANATGGIVAGIEIDKSGTGTLEVQGLHCNAGVIPIHQESGTFGSIEKAWEFESGPTWTDVTAAFNSDGTNVEIFSAENDIIYIGDAATFSEVNVTLATVASGAGVKPAFAFSVGGSSFTAFTPNDATNGFRGTGLLTWETGNLIGWATDTVNGTTDPTTAFLEASAGDVEIFSSDNDYILIGSDATFEAVDAILVS
ncbi:hypothetical protein LCGC14_2803740, partial [marine sediment metagenome]